MKRLLLIEGSVTEVKSESYFETKARIEDLEAQIEEMRASMREMVGRMADRGIVERAYRAMREPKPPTRKLTGKIPRYQRDLIEAGKLAD